MVVSIESISAIWNEKVKKQSQENAREICSFLNLLRGHNDAVFSEWFEKGCIKDGETRKRIDVTEAFFFNELERRKRNKGDDVGVTVSFWTGVENENSASISFTLGGFGPKPFNKNSCVISLSSENEHYRILENQESLKSLFLQYWKPDKLLVNGELC